MEAAARWTDSGDVAASARRPSRQRGPRHRDASHQGKAKARPAAGRPRPRLLRCVEAAFARDCVRDVGGERRVRAYVYESGLLDRDPEELLRLATPDIEYVNPPYAVEPGVRRGLVAVAQAMRRFAEVWEESRHELRELYDCGDVVVAAVNWHIRGRGSERELVNREAHTWTVLEGRIARSSGGRISGRRSRRRASRIRPPASGHEKPPGVPASR